MELNKKQQEVRKNINKLNIAITEAIDKICEESNYEITYSEINSALTDTLKSNLGYELREMWKKDEKEKFLLRTTVLAWQCNFTDLKHRSKELKEKLRYVFEEGSNEGAAGMSGAMYVLDFDEWYEQNEEKLVKLFAIPVVGQQRELLRAYHTYLLIHTDKEECNHTIEEFLIARNSG